MRAYAVLVAAIVLTATGCEQEQLFACMAGPGSDRCACVERQCNAGLTCVNGTCFDLSSWGSVSPSAAGGGSGAASAGTQAVIMSVMTGMVSMSSAGIGGSPTPAAMSGAAGSMVAAAGSNGAAGVMALTCAAVGSDCTVSSCCEGSVCISNSCSPICTSHQQCTSACCAPINPTLSACVSAMICQGTMAGAAAP